jgi:UDP-glucuronate decarboxylase
MSNPAPETKSCDQPVSIVTGGDGFIGRALSEYLRRDGHHVVVVDNHSSNPVVSRDDGIERYIENIEDINLSKLPIADYVFHLASVAHPKKFSSARHELFETNVVATAKLLDWITDSAARFVFASTSEVYGLAEEAYSERRGILENDKCSAATPTSRSIYPTTKRMGEELVVTARVDGVDAFSVRPFNIYGPGMDAYAGAAARVIPRFLDAAQRGVALPVHGDGQQVRSFMWIRDAVHSIAALAIRDELPPAVVNVGRDEPIAIIELAQLICELTGSRMRVDWLPPREEEPVWRRPDSGLLTRLIGYSPAVSLREGIGHIVAAMREGSEDQSLRSLSV